MKLEETKFTHPHDKDIFKALKRTIKDKIFIGENLAKRMNNSKLISSCYSSRNTHRAEGVYTNYMYWPGDIGITFNSLILGLIWVARVINIIGKENVTPQIKSDIGTRLGQINNYPIYNPILSKKEIVLISDNSEIINNAVSIVSPDGVTRNYTETLINIITSDKKNIPY